MRYSLIPKTHGDTLYQIFRHSTSVSVFEKLYSQLNKGGAKIHLGSAKNTGEDQGGTSRAAAAGLHIPSVAEAAPEVAAARAQQAAEEEKQEVAVPVRRDMPKVGRNEPCPCGSGKKFKQCCGRSA